MAKAMGFSSWRIFGSRFDREFIDALEKMDRARLVALLKAELTRDYYTKEEADTLLRILDPAFWYQVLKEITRQPGPMFQVHRGRKPKIPRRDYHKIADWGDRLAPVILKLLQELEFGTKRTIKELLEF